MIGVTGGTGFVGLRLVARLARTSPVRVLAHQPPPDPVPGVEYPCGDVCSTQAVARFVHGCATILHLAGIAHTNLRTPAARECARAVNVDGTRNVVTAALRQGVERIVFVSSALVYATQQGVGMVETDPLVPAGVYAETKIEAEACVRQAGERGLQAVIARPCLIYGPGARFNLQRMMRAIDAGYYFHIAGANPLRSVLSVENAARALHHLALASTPPGVYNLADLRPVRLADFVNDLALRMGRQNPHSIPASLARLAAAAGTAIERIGMPSPFSREALHKLTADFSLSTARLAQTGFLWDCDEGLARQQMVDFYLRSKNGGNQHETHL